jgi:hypothetical protein
VFNDDEIKILTALYLENKIPKPNYREAIRELGFSIPKSKRPLTKLDELGYITGYLGEPKSPGSRDRYKSWTLRNVYVTDKGSDYLAIHFNTDKTNFTKIAEEAAQRGGTTQDKFDYMTAYVKKITEVDNPTGNPKSSPSSVTVYNHGPVYSQQIGNNNTQMVTVNPEQDISEVIRNLKELLNMAPIPELEKGDVEEALESISNLAKKEKSEGVLERVKERLATIMSIVGSSQAICEQLKPSVTAIKAYFGI